MVSQYRRGGPGAGQHGGPGRSGGRGPRAALRPPTGPWVRSFAVAAAGVRRAWRSERNLRVQAAGAWAALGAGALARLPAPRLAVLCAVIGAVLATEIMNSAVEVLVDLASPAPHALAAAAKDLAAGAVLAVSASALAAGAALFWPLPAHLSRTAHTLASYPLAAAAGAAVLGVLIVLAVAPLPGWRGA